VRNAMKLMTDPFRARILRKLSTRWFFERRVMLRHVLIALAVFAFVGWAVFVLTY